MAAEVASGRDPATERKGAETEVDEDEYSLPADAGVGDYVMHPWRSMESFMKRLIGNFGWRIAVMMGVNYLLIKGLMMSVLGLIRLSYCKKTLGINGTQCQTMQAIAQTPWAIKGAFGVVSDAYPLFGYHKASYIIVSACMGTVAFFALATADNISVTVAATLLFAANFQIAVADLLCEGRYAALMQEKPHTGSTMVSYVWGCFQIGSLVAAMFVGPVADHYNPQVLFWFMIPMAASLMIPTGLGYLGDKRVAPEKEGWDWELMKQYPYIVGFCIIMACVALGNALVDTFFFEEHLWQMTYALSGALLLSVLAFLWLPRRLAMCNGYMFLTSILYVNIGGAQDFWFTAEQSCVPGGPSFDYTYYNTYTAVVGAFTGWIGIIIFQSQMSGWTFRKLFWVTTLMQVLASAFDLLIINRYNVAWGIPDKWFYMFGDAIIGPAVMMFAFMPAIVLTSKLVPKGLESTTYALLAGFQNFGGVVSSQVGIWATGAAGIETEEPCNFDNLAWLVGICHCILPLFAIPLTFVLIPDLLMSDKIIDDEHLNEEPTLAGEAVALVKDEGEGKDAKAKDQ